MKYILIASLLSCAAYAAPLAQQGVAGNGQTAQQGNGQAAQQLQGQQLQGQQQQGQQQQGQQQQGQQQQGQQQQGGQNVGANAPSTGTGAGIANGQTPSAADLATAVSNWQADTAMVSDFLNRGASIQNNIAFKQAATVAFNAEVDELNHKAIIDAVNGADPNVVAANSTLATGGSFQDVVDKLQLMSVQGRAAVANIDLINQNRCVNVLPNIDAYFASTGSASQAVRPTVCDQTGVAGGVQGAGPTLPGGTPGTPADAIAAASALAAGTGNGLVQSAGGAQGQQQAAQGGQQQAAQAGQQQAAQGQQQAAQAGQQQAAPAQQAAQGQQQAAPAQQATTPALQAAQGQQDPAQAQAPAQQAAAPAQQGQQAAAGNAAQQQQGQAVAAPQGQAATAPQAQAPQAQAQAPQKQAGAAAATNGQKAGAATQ